MSTSFPGSLRKPTPLLAGVGLRFAHLADFEAQRPDVGLLELHTENLFGLSPSVHRRLEALRGDYAFSLHGVGLSLGSAQGMDPLHLAKIARQIRRYKPSLVSEHLAWNRADGISVPDLLPLPMTKEALQTVSRNVQQVQEAIGTVIAVENISAYARWTQAEMSEASFLSELSLRTGCKLLVDLNNLHVNQLNHGDAPLDFLETIPHASVVEFHLAGPSEIAGAWIDTHATPVPEPVWALYETALRRFGPLPTIVEWDQDLPALEELVAHASRAQRLLKQAA